jgi:cytosine/creatinine deaminase
MMPLSLPPLPSGAAYWLRRARLPLTFLAHPETLAARADGEGSVLVDFGIVEGRIAAIVPAGTQAVDMPEFDLDGGMIWPSPVELHTHLDKGHIWPRAENPDGTFAAALAAVAADRQRNWTAADLRARMSFSLAASYAHGTRAIRTHLDSLAPQGGITWPVFAALRAEWASRVTLQGVSLVPIDFFRDAASGEALARLVAANRGILGAVTYMTPDLGELLPRVFALAERHELDLDFHVDETGDPAACSLRHIAETALARRFAGRIVCGHCCSLARQVPDDIDRCLDLVAAARIAIVSLPMCNLYLQDRAAGRTPRWRGVTLLHEMAARGIAVAISSDNVRDPFYGYGDLDAVEVFTMASRIAHLDRPVGAWPRALTTTPATIMGLADAAGLAVRGAADLILFRARFWHELLSRPQTDRVVLRNGAVVDATPPDYRELDALFRPGPSR